MARTTIFPVCWPRGVSLTALIANVMVADSPSARSVRVILEKKLYIKQLFKPMFTVWMDRLIGILRFYMIITNINEAITCDSSSSSTLIFPMDTNVKRPEFGSSTLIL